MRPIDGEKLYAVLDNIAAHLFETKSEPQCIMAQTIQYTMGVVRDQPDIAPPPNDPLTLDELREMEGKPLYDRMGYAWYVLSEIECGDVIMTDGTVFDVDEESPNNANGRFCRREPGRDDL